jgi:hypothetical protein
MISPILPPTSIRRVVLILAIVCLLAIFAGAILVAAHKDNNNLLPPASADQVTAAPVDAAAKTRIAEHFGKLPLSFEIHKGQMDQPVRFLSHGAGYDLFLTPTEAVLRVQRRALWRSIS